MNPRTLARFRVGGFDDESDKPTEPVQVTCARCGTHSPWMEFRDDGGADRTASLDELVVWAQDHRCPPPDAPAQPPLSAGEAGR